MELGLRGKVFFVSGSSRGIGRSVAEAILNEGGRTVICGRNSDSVDKTFGELVELHDTQVMSWIGDLTEPKGVDRALDCVSERWNRLDGVVANVGSGVGKPLLELTEQDWRSTFEANFMGSVRLVTRAKRFRDLTSVVFVSSIVGVENIPGAPLPYSTAKSALNQLSKALAWEWGPEGVRVNVVAPGNVLFPGGSWERKLESRPPSFKEQVESQVALRRFGKPDEIAKAVTFLLSDAASFISGSCLVVDGGQTRSV